MGIILTLSLSHPVSRKQRLYEALVDMIVKDGQPFSVVEDEGFRNFVKILDPSNTIPSRKSVKAVVEARYNIIREKTMAEVKQASAVSLTADMWTSINMDAYLAVTCHYVKENLDLATVLFRCTTFSPAPLSSSYSRSYWYFNG